MYHLAQYLLFEQFPTLNDDIHRAPDFVESTDSPFVAVKEYAFA
jgi:hypothetical protein